jgi:hypothetical protein
VNFSSANFLPAAYLIDNLNIRLPQGLEKRAGGIARNLGTQLARLPFAADRNLDIAALAIEGISISGGETDAVIAGRIARAIHQQLTAANANGGTAAAPDSGRIMGV